MEGSWKRIVVRRTIIVIVVQLTCDGSKVLTFGSLELFSLRIYTILGGISFNDLCD